MKLIRMLSIISIAVSACGDNNESLVIDLQNSPPVIKRIVVPDQVHGGARIKLDAVAEDADGDVLTYNWKVPEGLIRTKTITMPTAVWTAPIEMGVATVTLTINDGINNDVTKSADISVIHSLIVPGQEAAGIKLGTRFDKVLRLYGTPDWRAKVSTHEPAEERTIAEEYRNSIGTKFYWHNAGLTVYFDLSYRVYKIRIHEPNTAKTAGGNGIGSSRDELKTEFVVPSSGAGQQGYNFPVITEYWDQAGIGFTYDSSFKVMEIFIGLHLGGPVWTTDTSAGW